MAKENRRAKVPAQCASGTHGAERKIEASSMPLVGGQDSCFYSCGRHEPVEDKMKLSTAAVATLSAVLLLYPSQGFAQQQVGTPAASGGVGVSSNRETQAFVPSSSQSVARIRVTGTPGVQATPGLGIECTPVEQSIVGVIIGPTNLCDQ
jgi:hypothetical protein